VAGGEAAGGAGGGGAGGLSRRRHKRLNHRAEKAFDSFDRRNLMSNERELIDTGKDKRYVRRNEQGQFKESDDQGKSLARDVKQHAKTKKPRNQGDKGD
jgi:hypothetical protein